MSSGHEHARASVAVCVVGTTAALALTGDPFLAASVGVGALWGIALTPDLDQETISSFEWKLIKKTLGLGFLWLMLWWPYAIMIKHRSWISHFPLISTAIRLLYLSPLWWLAGHPWHPLACAAIVGLVLSDSVHWFMDQLTPAGIWGRRRKRA